MPMIRVIATPTDQQIATACAVLTSDWSYNAAWPDTSLQIFTEWRKSFESGERLLYLWTVDGMLAGMEWLHDRGHDTDGSHAWLGGLMFPAFRGRKHADLRVRGWQAIKQRFDADGHYRIFAACLHHNLSAIRWTEGVCGFTNVGTYRDWSIHRNRLIDVTLLTLRPQDQSLLWVLAEQRAEDTRQLYRMSHSL